MQQNACCINISCMLYAACLVLRILFYVLYATHILPIAYMLPATYILHAAYHMLHTPYFMFYAILCCTLSGPTRPPIHPISATSLPIATTHTTGIANQVASDVCHKVIPEGLSTPFPHNCIALMTVTGAKGSSANLQQITLLLGQQSYEGRRAPLTASGKTLPCFSEFDVGARAYGFIGDRYFSGRWGGGSGGGVGGVLGVV